MDELTTKLWILTKTRYDKIIFNLIAANVIRANWIGQFHNTRNPRMGNAPQMEIKKEDDISIAPSSRRFISASLLPVRPISTSPRLASDKKPTAIVRG